MGGINKIPLGYLDMVGTETGGRNPFDALETVSPIVQMDPFYQSQAMFQQALIGAMNTGPVNQQAVITVPNEEVWFLWGASTRWTAGGALETSEIVLDIQGFPRGVNGIVPVHNFPVRIAAAVGDGQIDTVIFTNPIPLLSGTKIRFLVIRTGGPARPVDLFVWGAKFSG